MRRGAVKSFGLIAGAFIDAQRAVFFSRDVGVFKGGNGGSLGQHGQPFLLEVHQRGDVGLHGFETFVVGVAIAEVWVDIFVGQAADAVSEFVGQYHKGHTVQRTHGIEIVDATAAIGVAVGHDDDMVAGGPPDGIVEFEKALGHEVSVGSKGAVAGAHQAVDMHSLGGIGDARGLARGADAPDIEVVAMSLEGFLAQHVLTELLHVAQHLGSVGGAIAFGYDNHIYFFVYVAAVVQPERLLPKRDRTAPEHLVMAHLGVVEPGVLGVVVMVLSQLLPADEHRLFGPWHTHHLFESCYAVGARRGVAVFGKKTVVATAVKSSAGLGIFDHNTEIAVVEWVDELGERTRPLAAARIEEDLDGVGLTVAHPQVVNAQSFIRKVLVELDFLSLGGAAGKEQDKQAKECCNFLHNYLWKRYFL